MYLASLNKRTFPVDQYGEKPSPTIQKIMPLTSGLAGIKETLRYMRIFVDQYKTHQNIRELALQLTRGIPQKAYTEEARALTDFVKNKIRYTRDVNGIETVQTPLKTLEYGAGDCDDKATLLAALLESIGFETRFHAMGFKRNDVSHVLLECDINGTWVSLETTEPVRMGWLPPNIIQSIYG
jgi:transglutaminase-like putative cysteine protease